MITTSPSLQTYIERRIHQLADKMDEGNYLWSHLKIPYLKLETPTFSPQILIEEARKLESFFVEHRENDSQGWKSLCIHGLSTEKTRDCHFYGYKNESEVPYTWTEQSALAPQLVNWLQQLLREDWFKKFYRVRYMWLKPGGYIHFHTDRSIAEKRLGPLNIALNMPENCHWIFKDYGPVPFCAGDAIAVDVSNYHGVWNNSDQDRIHIIIHGEYGAKYFDAISTASKKLRVRKPISSGIFSQNLAIGLQNHLTSDYPIETSKQLDGLTHHFLRMSIRKPTPIIEHTCMKQILNMAHQQNVDFCVVIKTGKVVSADFIQKVEHHIHSARESFYVDKNFFIINVKDWRLLGEPSEKDFLAHKNIYNTSDTSNNISTEVIDLLEKPLSNDHLLSLLDGHSVNTWKMDPPEKNSSEQERAIFKLATELHAWRKKIFVFNTEGYLDILNTRPKKPLDTLYLLASGFKDLFLIHSLANNNPIHKIVYFDVSESALLFKKYIYEHWRGENFPDFLKNIILNHRLPIDTIFSVNADDVENQWARELRQWPSENAFYDALKKWQTIPVEFIQTDIVEDPSPLLYSLKRHSNTSTALWYSNCFSYSPTLSKLNWDIKEVKKRGYHFLSKLRELENDTLLFGEDISWGCKTQLCGFYAKEMEH